MSTRHTCLVILQKCSQKKEREENLVRFVNLKKPLSHFVPPVEDSWEDEINRRNQVEKLKELVLGQNQFYENEEIRIYPKSQRELWDEGYDQESKKYVGSKWGKYIRAPQIFFKILEKGKGKLVPLKEIADVRRGFTTGANEFFYLTEEKIKQWGIEKEFWMHKEGEKWVPNKVFVRANELRSSVILPSQLKNVVLIVNKKVPKSSNVYKYTRMGERKGYNKRPTCKSREPRRKWYDLGKNINSIIAFPERVRLRHIVFYNPNRASLNKNLYGIEPFKKELAQVVALVLNSTLTPLYTELLARQPGGGGGPLDMDVYIAKEVLAPNPEVIGNYEGKLLNLTLNREVGTLFEEVGTSSPEEVSLDKVKPDRRELDKVVMGDILGLTEEEQLEVYRAVVDLVSSRIKKARSVERKKKIKGGIDIDAFVKTVMDGVGERTLAKFYQEKILTHKPLYTKKLPKSTSEVGFEAELGLKFEEEIHKYRLYSGRKHIFCKSELEARYLKVWLEARLESVKVPKDEDRLAKIVPQLERLMEKIKKIIESYTDSILQPKLRQRILYQLWQKITEGIE